jgi:hypothetical protein
MFKLSFVALAVAVWLSLIGQASANHVRDFTLEEKVAQSEAVFIGTVLNPTYPMKREFVSDVALVQVTTILKGSPGPKTFVAYGAGPESPWSCCVKNGVYLFFVGKTVDGIYAPTDEGYGIYQVNPAPQVP